LANFYVDSADGDNGSPPSVTWWNGDQATYATVAGALAAATGVGPHVIYVSHTHEASINASITYNAATENAEIALLSVNRSTGLRAVGAAESTAANGQLITVISAARNQYLYWYGFTFTTNSDISTNAIRLIGSSSHYSLTMESCTFTLPGTGSSNYLVLGHDAATSVPNLVLINCHLNSKVSTANGATIGQIANTTLIGFTHAYAGATKSTSFMVYSNQFHGNIHIIDSDLSGFNAGSYFNVANRRFPITFRNTKLHATPDITTGTFLPQEQVRIYRVNSDSADTIGFMGINDRAGVLTRDLGVYANSGYTHFSVNQSFKLVTTSNCNEHRPFISQWFGIPSDATSTVNVDVHIDHDSATNLHDRDIWLEVEYVSSASFPLGTLATGRNADPFVGNGTDWAASSETWTGTGGFGNENKQRIRVTITPAEKSLVRGRLFVTAASKTLYIDPRLRISA
jgi:hypothetical protein